MNSNRYTPPLKRRPRRPFASWCPVVLTYARVESQHGRRRFRRRDAVAARGRLGTEDPPRTSAGTGSVRKTYCDISGRAAAPRRCEILGRVSRLYLQPGSHVISFASNYLLCFNERYCERQRLTVSTFSPRKIRDDSSVSLSRVTYYYDACTLQPC